MGIEQSVHKSRTVPACDETMSFRVRNNCKRLHFHQVHGDNIKLSKDRTVACRSEGFCRGIVFSDRPVMVWEPVYIKFLETSPNWSGALRIGFTMNDPMTMKSKLPRYACPDLTSIHGNWAKAVGEKLARKDSILYYYVDQIGDVHYGIDAEEYGVFFGGVNTSGKLWAVLDIYGNTVAVEFIDPRPYSIDCLEDSQAESICRTKDKLKDGSNLKPVSFHQVHGKNVTLKRNGSIVCRKTGLNTSAYVFSEHPVEIGEKIYMTVKQTDHYFEENFIYGITSCDPKLLEPSELPENVDDLYDRPEYWVVKLESYPFKIGDTITLSISNDGEVTVSANTDFYNSFYVDHTQPLWFFLNLSNSVCELQLLGITSSNNSANESSAEKSDSPRTSNFNGAECAKPGPSGHQTTTSECVICYEELVDCALYRCGHMCMCYKCALKLWNSGSSAQCPICRNSIDDVIKVYK